MIIQGPLAGYSCSPFRRLIWRFGNPAFCTTEMISAKDLRYRKQKPQRYLYRDESEKVLSYQIAGRDPDDIKYATEAVSAAGADIIDLNCGCPKPKIRRKGLGTKLLTQPELLYELVSAMRKNTHAQVSIKIRVSEPANDHDDFAVIDAAQSAGVNFIIVHGRHWTEKYDVNCRIEPIKRIKQYAKVPIIANGDVDSLQQYQNLLDVTGCDGIMISRATVGQPWLIGSIQAGVAKQDFKPPTQKEIGQIFIEHLSDLIKLDGDFLAVMQSRKLAKYYARTLINPTQFVLKMQETTSLQQAIRLIQEAFSA